MTPEGPWVLRVETQLGEASLIIDRRRVRYVSPNITWALHLSLEQLLRRLEVLDMVPFRVVPRGANKYRLVRADRLIRHPIGACVTRAAE